MRRKVHTRVESGTCNVCSAPCSSCRHRKLACMGSKDDEHLDENYPVTATSENSINKDNILPCKKESSDSLLHTTNEAYNMLSVNLTRDSLSENAESKEKIMGSDITDAAVESEMIQKLPLGENVAGDQKAFSNEPSKGVGGDVDTISCVSRANDADAALDHSSKSLDRKNLLGSSVLVSSLGHEESGKALVSPKPELLETPSDDADAGSSPKVQSSCPSSTTNDIHIEEDMKLDTSRVSSQLNPKKEIEVKKESGEQQDENSKCPNQFEQDEKSNESAELSDAQEHALQSVSADESDESDIVEQDVKVCDICGDAGREDLLAICSKCSDGAEHTYCMREMLLKVPEGDWLCEECKLAEETEKQKEGSDAEGKRMNKDNSRSSIKRLAETMEAASASKRQAIESSFGSPKSSPTRVAALSRDNSFKGLDKGKVKLAHQTSFAHHSNSDNLEAARSSSIALRLQTPKGTLLKSNSFNTFNSKPKVRPVDEVPQKQRSSRDLDLKEGTARMMSKSMSFRPVNSGRSNGTESKVKMISSKISEGQDMKGLKSAKDRSAFENRTFSRLDRPGGSSLTTSSNASGPKFNQKLTPRGENALLSSAGNNRESKASQPDGKFGSLLRSTSSLARKGAENPSSSGRTSLATGASSASVEQKGSPVSPKDEPSSSSSWTAERLSNNIDDNSQDGLSRSRESSSQSEKTRESFANRSRPGVTTALKNVTCQKCKEIGHTAEFCSVVSPRASSVDAAAARTVREDVNSDIKLKAALEAAMLKKPGLLRKKKESEQSDGLALSNVDATSEMASQDQSHDLFGVPNKTKIVSDEGQSKIGSSAEANKLINSNNIKPPNIYSSDALDLSKAGDSDPVVPSDRSLTLKLPLSKLLTIPEHECIWQGVLEVRRNGKFLDLYSGLQAHLSTCASPKVLEVVNQFPHKITLDEVPRLSTWPSQFHENGAKEDNIALYFFAKDLESYEKSYKSLLDNMIKRDFALKVCFEGVEFLVFPSTQLPENSQRWNMLFFLWGVFRGRRSNCSDSMQKSPFHNFGAVPLDINTLDKACSVVNGDRDSGVSSSQIDLEQANDRLIPKSLSKDATNNGPVYIKLGCPDPSQEEVVIPEVKQDGEHEVVTQAAGTNSGSNSREESPAQVDTSCVGADSSSVEVFHASKQDNVREIADDEKAVDRMNIDRDEVKAERNLNEDPPDMNAEASPEIDDGWQSNSRKRPFLDLTEEAPEIYDTSTQNLPWVKVNNKIVDGDGVSKKLKTVFHEQYRQSSIRERTSFTDGFTSQRCDLNSSSSADGQRCETPVDEKVIHEDLGTTERYFFPVESRRVNDILTGGNSIPWKEYSSNDESQFRDGIPNLELALGAETKHQNKGIMPFYVGMVEKNNHQNKIPEKVTEKEEEDLSLSLSFPFPQKEQTVKPVSKTEQILPDRRHVNTSLLLFGGFSDK